VRKLCKQEGMPHPNMSALDACLRLSGLSATHVHPLACWKVSFKYLPQTQILHLK
jgi:hypothetical protein